MSELARMTFRMPLELHEKLKKLTKKTKGALQIILFMFLKIM
jgi:predicted DNA-binding protein